MNGLVRPPISVNTIPHGINPSMYCSIYRICEEVQVQGNGPTDFTVIPDSTTDNEQLFVAQLSIRDI